MHGESVGTQTTEINCKLLSRQLGIGSYTDVLQIKMNYENYMAAKQQAPANSRLCIKQLLHIF
jgi:hypothetical protein